jgi:hypothetical protein
MAIGALFFGGEERRGRIVPYLKAKVKARDIFGFKIVEGNENLLHARSSLRVVIHASSYHLHHIL